MTLSKLPGHEHEQTSTYPGETARLLGSELKLLPNMVKHGALMLPLHRKTLLWSSIANFRPAVGKLSVYCRSTVFIIFQTKVLANCWQSVTCWYSVIKSQWSNDLLYSKYKIVDEPTATSLLTVKNKKIYLFMFFHKDVHLFLMFQIKF